MVQASSITERQMPRPGSQTEGELDHPGVEAVVTGESSVHGSSDAS